MRATVDLSVALAALGAGFAAAVAPSCPSNSPISCQTTSTITNTCCTEVQGQVLQVQFWDTNPATGPQDHWTIHGLWPDNCDGTYEQYCDPSREYTNISCILQQAGSRGQSILSYMETYWKDQSGGDESFWEHEWNKHGTCYSTLQPKCFQNYQPNEEVVDFFDQTISLFKTIPTYQYLANAGIYPTTAKNYTFTEVNAALRQARGVNATIQCSNGELYEIWYTFNVRGSIANGQYIPVEPVGEKSSCPSSFKYPPKDLSTTPKVSATSCPNIDVARPTAAYCS